MEIRVDEGIRRREREGETRIRLPLERLISANVAYIPKERTVKQIYHPGRTVWYGKGGEVKYIVTEEGKYIFPEEEKSPTPTEPPDLKGVETEVKAESKAVEDPLKSLKEFHKLHPDLPQPDILHPSPVISSEEEIKSWEESAQQSFWWESDSGTSKGKGAWEYETEREKEAGYPVEEITSNIPTKPKEKSPYSIMSKKFISRTPESELEHPTAVGTSSPVEEIVEESYRELLEEKTAPEFTFETMPERIYSEGNLVFWRPTEYYYWYLFTKRQFEERGIPYSEEELKKFARERHRVYTEYMEFLEVLPKIDKSKLKGIDLESLRRDVEKFLFSPPAVILTRKELHQLSMEKLLKLEEDIMKTAHPQEVPGIMASLHSELEYTLEKYFPTPDIPEDTLAGKGIAWTKNLPPILREVAQFGVGIFGPLEEYRELGNYLGIPQPNVPTMLGGMISGMFGSTEEIRMVEKYPAYAIGTLAGEVVWDYLLGKAAAKGIQKFFGWVESKVPKTPEGRWIVAHYPPVTRRVLRGLERMKKFLIQEKQVADILEEVRGRGVFFMDYEEGIRGATKSFLKITTKEMDELVDSSRLLKSGDVLVGEYAEARGFLSKSGEMKFATRTLENFEMKDIGDIAEFTRRLKEVGAEEGIMFKFIEEEGVRVPNILEIRPTKGGIQVTRFTPTALFEEEFPLKYFEEGTEAFKYRFEPRGIKIKPEEDILDLKPPSEGADFDEWYRYWTKKLEVGKMKYGLGKPSGVEDIDELMRKFTRQLEEGKAKYGFRGEPPEGLTAVGVGEQQQILTFMRGMSREISSVDFSNLILGIRRVSRTSTIPMIKLPSVSVPTSKELISEVLLEEPKLDTKLKEEVEEILKPTTRIPVKITTEPILSIRKKREGRRMRPDFSAIEDLSVHDIFTPSISPPEIVSVSPKELSITAPDEILIPKEEEITVPPVEEGLTKSAPPLIPPLPSLGGGFIGGSRTIGRWKRWTSKWFDVESLFLGKSKISRKRKSKKRKKKRKRRGRRK